MMKDEGIGVDEVNLGLAICVRNDCQVSAVKVNEDLM